MKLKDLPLNDRPRERLIQNGVKGLSNEELIAIIINTGTINNSSKVIANNILSLVTSVTNLDTINYQQLIKIRGIKQAKATKILAAIELGLRISNHNSHIVNLQIKSSTDIYNYYKNILCKEKQECFYCVYLDNKKHILADKLLFKGTINYSVVHPREIFKEAYLLSASAIICIHNHPSGNEKPSDEDTLITNKINEISKIFGIKLLDHIIIGNNYYSFFENDLIQ